VDNDIVIPVKKCSPNLKSGNYPTAIVGALFLFKKNDNSLLLQLRDEKPNLRHAGLWVPPGGHSEPHETIEECARREFYEETNYYCDNLNWFSAFIIKNPQWPNFLLGIFWSLYDGLQEIKCNEGQSVRFIKRREATFLPIPHYIFPIWDSIVNLFEKNKEKIF